MTIEAPTKVHQVSTWHDFVRNYWERQPAVISGLPASIHLSEDEIFDLLLQSREPAQRAIQGGSVRVNIHVRNASVVWDRGSYLPDSTDQNLQGYLDRIENLVGGEPFYISINGIQALSWNLWRKTAAFLQGLYSTLEGIPGLGTELHLFVGRYPVTPFGIHVDDISTFKFVFRGSKSMLTWPPELADTLPVNQQNFDSAVGDAVTLTGDSRKPEDFLYWPSPYYHVGESASNISVSLSVGIKVKPLTMDELVAPVWSELGRSLAAIPFVDKIPFQDSSPLPEEIGMTAAAMARVTSGAPLQTRIASQWLRAQTGYGFRFLPKPSALGVALGPRHVLSGDPVALLKSLPDPSGADQTLVSTHGFSCIVPGAGWVQPLLSMISSQQSFSLQETAAVVGPDDFDAATSLLRQLIQWRAVFATDRPASGAQKA
jgi:hypothetical protein